MRAFVAVEVGGATTASPEHLTLRFLGDVTPDRVPTLVAALRPVAVAVAPFEVVLEGVGAFPSGRDPRVVWVGVTIGRAALVALAERVVAALTPVVGPPDRAELVPHLTLFRVRNSADRTRARDILDGRQPPPAPRTVPVREFQLKESRLEPRGAVHRTVERFPLTGPT